MNVSDYVQGSLDAACQSDSVSYSLNSQACRNNNWIFYSSNPDGYERMMTLMAHSTSRLWILTGMGFLDGNYGDAAVSWRFRPVGYLSSEISIKAGDGTAANPWIIE